MSHFTLMVRFDDIEIWAALGEDWQGKPEETDTTTTPTGDDTGDTPCSGRPGSKDDPGLVAVPLAQLHQTGRCSSARSPRRWGSRALRYAPPAAGQNPPTSTSRRRNATEQL